MDNKKIYDELNLFIKEKLLDNTGRIKGSYTRTYEKSNDIIFKKNIDKINNTVNFVNDFKHKVYCIQNYIYEMPICCICNNRKIKDIDRDTCGYKECISKKISDSFKNTYKRLSKDKIKLINKKKANHLKEYWKNLSEEEKKHLKKKQKISVSKFWKNRSKENKKKFGEKVSKGWSKKSKKEKEKIWKKRSKLWEDKEKKEAFIKKMKKVWEDLPEKTKIEMNNKRFLTRKKRNTFKSSKLEKKLLIFLRKTYKDIKYQYRNNEKYPYNCDYYIPSLNLYIELQGNWTHGGCSFDIKNKKHLEKLKEFSKKAINSDYYKIAIYVWTKNDVEKRNIAKINNLNYLEIFYYKNFNDILRQIKRVKRGLLIKNSKKDLIDEFFFFKKTNKEFNSISYKNKIILEFQKHFYYKENRLWKDPVIRRKLIENRCFYLDKKEEELTDRELLRGFKIGGFHKGYSHFNPFWMKTFIKKYDIKSIYDPCGGWGHRFIGAWDINYIYNDYDIRTYRGVKKINGFFKKLDKENKKSKIFYNNNAENFTPLDEYECVFTCPPYFNLEKYSFQNKEKTIKEWAYNWWDNVISSSIKNKDIKFFAYVITSKYKEIMNRVCEKNGLKLKEEIILRKIGNSHFNKNSKNKNYEVLCIFE